MITKVLALKAVLAAAALASMPTAAADPLIVAHRLPVTLAKVGIDAARERCAADGFEVSVAVVNREGGLLALERADGAGVQTVQSATDKAITSAVFGVDSSVWVDRAEAGQPVSPLLNELPNLLLARGGVVIEVQGEVISGLAVAGAPGGELDDVCARVGRDAIMSAITPQG